MQLLYGIAKLEYDHKIEIAFLSCKVFYFLYCSYFLSFVCELFLIRSEFLRDMCDYFKMESVFLLSQDRIFFIICIFDRIYATL